MRVTKVADFGLARSKGVITRLTQSGMAVGTPDYMAPEQCKGTGVDARSDLYSLTCTYYALLIGHAPFQGADESSDPAAVLYRHVHEALPDPRCVVPDLPDGICRILARGSQKEPAERYQSAEEMLADLDAVLSAQESQFTFGTPWQSMVEVCRPPLEVSAPRGLAPSLSTTVLMRLGEHLKRKPVLLAVPAAIAVLIIIGAIAWPFRVARRSEPAAVPVPAAELLEPKPEVLAAQMHAVRARASAVACKNNLKLLGNAVMLYAYDHDDRFPPAATWCHALKDYVGGSRDVFQCPDLPGEECAYGLNENLAGHSMAHIRDYAITVLLFETDGGWNVSGGREHMIQKPRHPSGYSILFVDGHVRTVPEDELDGLVWSP